MKHLIEVDIPDGDYCDDCVFCMEETDNTGEICVNPELDIGLLLHVKYSGCTFNVVRTSLCREKYDKVV